jgi:lysyl-tRNA synthetase class 2
VALKLRGAYRRRVAVASTLATITWLFAVATLVDAVLPGQRDRVNDLTQIIPVPATAAATAITAAAGLLLLRVSTGLRRGKRQAWRLSLVLVSLLVVTHVLKGLDVEEALVSSVLLAMLATAGDQFPGRSDPTSRWVIVRVVGQFLIIGVIAGVAIPYLRPTLVIGHPSIWERLLDVIVGMAGFNGPLVMHGGRSSDIYRLTLLAFGIVAVLSVVYLLLRPAEPIATLSADDEARLRELIVTHGSRDSLAYFALRRDKAVVFSPTGKSAVTYRAVHGVALASGDPLGAPDAWAGAITGFLDLARQQAWVPAVIGCSELAATAYQREGGLDALELGDEAMVEVADFNLEGRPMRGVRQAIVRVQRAGYVASVQRVSDMSDADLAEARAAADNWRGDAIERGYSMALSRLGDPADVGCVMVTARLEGKLAGLLHFVPWGPDGLSLDLMRRDRTSENGLNEFLIVSLLQGAAEIGVRRVSLNFAVFRSALERGGQIGAGPVLRLWRAILLIASRWWQIETLYRFNVKFRPEWEPRFLSFPNARDLPRIAIAALEAEAFVNRPRGDAQAVRPSHRGSRRVTCMR